MKEAYGLLDNRYENSKLPTDTISPLASISKPLTAACLMLLMDDGILDPSNLVNIFIPEFSGKYKENVSIHHCLTHTTGINDERIWRPRVNLKKLPPCPENQHPWLHKHLHKIYKCPLKREPGKLMTYSRVGYLLIAEIIRRLTGKNLEEFARERIFDPMGMNSTFFIVPDKVAPRIVRRRDSDPRSQWLNDSEF